MLRAIIACDDKMGIGLNGVLPWHIPEDLKEFKRLTMGASVMMGRKTYFSLPSSFRPLPDRTNVIVTRHPREYFWPSSIQVWTDAHDACRYFSRQKIPMWIIGGAQLYAETVQFCSELYITRVKGDFNADTFLPLFGEEFELFHEETRSWGSFQRFRRIALSV